MSTWVSTVSRGPHQDTVGRTLELAPAVAAVGYPLILRAFNATVGLPGTPLSLLQVLTGVLLMAAVFAIPIAGFIVAARSAADGRSSEYRIRARRVACLCVAAPTLFCFVGVTQLLLSSPIPDDIVWAVLWLGVLAWAWSAPRVEIPNRPDPVAGALRVAHGISGSLILLYVGFHLFNHLFGLLGPEAHTAVMQAGRKVYRLPAVEPVLVLLMLFQIGSGLRLAWLWSAVPAGIHRTFQVASGLYLAVYILGHMNSVFVYARSFMGIDSGWAFATGGDLGLIHDPWSVRLLPHYTIAVFFVLGHLASGLRGVLLAHGARPETINRAWLAGVVASALAAIIIMSGMSGVRI